MTVDKTSLTLIAFMVVFGSSMIFYLIGTSPEIFKQGEKLDLALYQQHEDDAREKQVKQIVTLVDEEVDRLKVNITKLMKDSETRSNISKAQRDLFDKKLDINTIQNTKILNSLANKSKDHEAQSIKMEALSDRIAEALNGYRENSIEKFDKIVENQIEINKKLGILLNKTN